MRDDILKKYIRDNWRHPIGLILAMKGPDGKWSIGWSLCHKEDEYDRITAHRIAVSRCTNRRKSPADFNTQVPESLMHEIEEMFGRGMRYFKDSQPAFSLNDHLYFEDDTECTEDAEQ